MFERNNPNDGDSAEVTGWTLLGTLRVEWLLTGKGQRRDAITLDQIVSDRPHAVRERVCTMLEFSGARFVAQHSEPRHQLASDLGVSRYCPPPPPPCYLSLERVW